MVGDSPRWGYPQCSPSRDHLERKYDENCYCELGDGVGDGGGAGGVGAAGGDGLSEDQ